VETQNITLALPKALLRKAKIVAAQRETSVSALLTATLEELVRKDDEYDSAMRRLVSRARRGYDLGSGGQIAIAREQLHER
jgi:hypothetical protein